MFPWLGFAYGPKGFDQQLTLTASEWADKLTASTHTFVSKRMNSFVRAKFPNCPINKK